MSLQIKNSYFGLYKYFRIASNLSINWLKFAERTLYEANILKLDDFSFKFNCTDFQSLLRTVK